MPRYFRMQLQDQNASGEEGELRPYYRTWVVEGTPDMEIPYAEGSDSRYVGGHFGETPNLTDITILTMWETEDRAAAVTNSQQAAWVVDPAIGNDQGTGTAEFPLATVRELNLRLSNRSIHQNTTVSLVGDQADAMCLASTKIANGATVTVSGTVTNIASGVISSVTPLGTEGTSFPWRLVTTGLDWTSQSARRIQISAGASMGAIAWVLSVVDANTIVICALGNLSTNTITPTATMTFDVQTLSTMPASQFYIQNGGQMPATFTSLVVRDLLFISVDGAGEWHFEGPRVAVFGCQFTMKTNSILMSSAHSLVLRQCKLQGTALLPYDIWALAAVAVIGCAFNDGLVNCRGSSGALQVISAGADGAILGDELGIRLPGKLWMQNVDTSNAAAVNVREGRAFSAYSTLSRLEGANITGTGVAIFAGAHLEYNPTSKPTIAGSLGAARIGGTIKSWGEIPYIEPTNHAMIVETQS